MGSISKSRIVCNLQSRKKVEMKKRSISFLADEMQLDLILQVRLKIY